MKSRPFPHLCWLLLFLLCWQLGGAAPVFAEPLGLGTAYELALRNDPRIRARRFQAEARQELPRQANAQLFPQVSASTASGKSNYTLSYLPQPVEETTFQYSLSLFQPLFRPEMWQRVDYATLQAEAARIQLRIDEQKLASEVAKAYFDALLTGRGVEFARRRMDAYQRRHQKLEGYLARGLTTKMDTLEAKVEFDRARAEWLAETSRLQIALLSLRNLTGLANLQLPEELHSSSTQIVDKPEWEDPEFWRSMLGNSLEVRLAEVSLALARSDIKVRRYEQYPKIDARLSYSDSDSSEFSTRRNDTRGMIEVNIPIFQGGYGSSRVEEARLSAESAREEVLFQTKTATEMLERYWTDYRLASDRGRALADSRISSLLLLEATEKAHAAGLQDAVRVLEAQAKVAEVERELVRAQGDAVSSAIGLLSTVGELSPVRLRELEDMVLTRVTAGGTTVSPAH